eukprot:TRINITY_DN67599_c6_g1_i1.p2 TRINITY_DN67599_c6_g1~~TRINITY_DN67599_c6_g1_i1.p2  ORF type:complete len:105 (-),score=23.27 TRINITY_DN67599_c6_g1_i1:141-455(-)
MQCSQCNNKKHLNPNMIPKKSLPPVELLTRTPPTAAHKWEWSRSSSSPHSGGCLEDEDDEYDVQMTPTTEDENKPPNNTHEPFSQRGACELPLAAEREEEACNH